MKLVQLRSGLKAQVHAVMGKEGFLPPLSDIFGPGGRRILASLDLAEAYTNRLESLRGLIDHYDAEVASFERRIHMALAGHPGYNAIQAIPGVGRTLAAVFVAEIGDASRFPSADKLCSWAGLTPRHRESDTKVIRGRVTKQGSRRLRWAAIEAVSHNSGGSFLQAHYHRLAEQTHNRYKARTAVARRLLTLVYYGMRDGDIRCLNQHTPAA
jgi:transposase